MPALSGILVCLPSPHTPPATSDSVSRSCQEEVPRLQSWALTHALLPAPCLRGALGNQRPGAPKGSCSSKALRETQGILFIKRSVCLLVGPFNSRQQPKPKSVREGVAGPFEVMDLKVTWRVQHCPSGEACRGQKFKFWGPERRLPWQAQP